jgi:hypothetical protein
LEAAGRTAKAVLKTAALMLMLMALQKPSTCSAQNYGERYWTLPAHGTFFFVLMGGTNGPPSPFCPYDPADVPVYLLSSSNQWFLIDDSEIPVPSVPDPPGEGEGGGGGVESVPYSYGPADFYLTIEGTDDSRAYLTAHGTTNGLTYELFSRTNVGVPPWIPEQLFIGESNETPVVNARLDRPILFFVAAQGGNDLVSISPGTNAVAPYPTNDPGEVGFFLVQRTTVTANPLSVSYYVSGTASNGCQYTFLPGTVTIPANTNTAVVQVQPITNCPVVFEETVTLTLVVSNGYFVDPQAYTATIFLEGNPSAIFKRVVTNLDTPVGIDYYPPLQSLLVTTGSATDTNNFMRIYTNIVFTNSAYITNVVVTNWTDITSIPDEVKIATAKSTSDGWTNGDLFFGNGTKIGWISADGTNHIEEWGTLTNSTMTNDLELRGSLYLDRTGVFSNNLIAVTGNGLPLFDTYSVWRIDPSRHSTLIAEIPGLHLEGAITVTNDLDRWGPFAGKILTGDEWAGPVPLIYAIAPDGSTTNFDLGIASEDFDIIPPDQDLYCTDPITGDILKVSKTVFAGNVGDLLVTQAGEAFSPREGSRLFVAHWDGTQFVTKNLFYFDRATLLSGRFEHVTFGPVDLPTLQ